MLLSISNFNDYVIEVLLLNCVDHLRCMDCNDVITTGTAYGTKYKCGDCHSAYRFCRDNVQNWHRLSTAEKKSYILTNKGKGGRGKKRELVSVQAVSVDDYQTQGGDAVFMNEVWFKKKLRKRPGSLESKV